MAPSFTLFLAAIVFGMGFRVGQGLIQLIVWVAAKCVGQQPPPVT